MLNPSVDDLLKLARRLRWPPDDDVGPVPVPTDELQAFEEQIGRPLSPDLRDWLGVCNGARIARGGVFGLRPDDEFVDIRMRLGLEPDWIRLGWVPIAGDGCGSLYFELPATALREAGWVAFVDCLEAQDQVTYFVASSVRRFLWFLFTAELDELSGWPCDRDYVVGHDAAMGDAPADLQCWNL